MTDGSLEDGDETPWTPRRCQKHSSFLHTAHYSRDFPVSSGCLKTLAAHVVYTNRSSYPLLIKHGVLKLRMYQVCFFWVVTNDAWILDYLCNSFTRSTGVWVCMSLNVCLCGCFHIIWYVLRGFTHLSASRRICSLLCLLSSMRRSKSSSMMPKKILLAFSLKDTRHIGSRVSTIRWSIGHSSIRLHAWSTVFQRRNICLERVQWDLTIMGWILFRHHGNASPL